MCVLSEPRQKAAPGAARRIRRFAAPKVSFLVLLITCAAWLTSLSVVALVPIDVYTTLASKEVGALGTLWSVSYWCGA